MKTTIEIEDTLFQALREAATESNTTLRSLMEEGLRLVLARRKSGGTFTLRDASVDGHGMNPEFADAGWDAVRQAVYEGRGG